MKKMKLNAMITEELYTQFKEKCQSEDVSLTQKVKELVKECVEAK